MSISERPLSEDSGAADTDERFFPFVESPSGGWLGDAPDAFEDLADAVDEQIEESAEEEDGTSIRDADDDRLWVEPTEQDLELLETEQLPEGVASDETGDAVAAPESAIDPTALSADEIRTAREEALLELTGDTVGQYLKEIEAIPLLSLEEEQQLGTSIRRGRLARTELVDHELSDEPGEPLSPLVRRGLIALIRDGNEAEQQLRQANTRLVVSVAKKHIGRGVPFLDLISEGNIGLMRAIKKWEPERGYRFSTYATWWIRQGVTRAVSDHSRTIRVPVHMGSEVGKFLHMQTILEERLGRAPTDDEVAEALGFSPTKMQSIHQALNTKPISLDAPASNDDDDSVIGDFIEDKRFPSAAEVTSAHQLTEVVEQALDWLPPREARILRLRFGIGTDRSYTLEEVGRKLGITRERVRQLEASALSRLRSPTADAPVINLKNQGREILGKQRFPPVREPKPPEQPSLNDPMASASDTAQASSGLGLEIADTLVTYRVPKELLSGYLDGLSRRRKTGDWGIGQYLLTEEAKTQTNAQIAQRFGLSPAVVDWKLYDIRRQIRTNARKHGYADPFISSDRPAAGT
jgi:RNA polymerase primary sigma factor